MSKASWVMEREANERLKAEIADLQKKLAESEARVKLCEEAIDMTVSCENVSKAKCDSYSDCDKCPWGKYEKVTT